MGKVQKIPLGVKLIFFLYILFFVFYFFFGALFSQLIFHFASLMMSSGVPVSESVLSSASDISLILVDSFFPFLAYVLNSNYIYAGILGLLASLIYLLIALSLLKGISFVRYLAIFYSVFELGIGVSAFLQGGVVSAIFHFIVHGAIIIYLSFSTKVRRFFVN